MSDNKTQNSDSWDTYWQGSRDGAAYTAGGVSHPLLSEFWNGYLGHAQRTFASPRILDVASGSGAVLERVQSAFGDPMPAIHCVDISEAAVKSIKERFPGVQGIVADAADMPLDASQFDIVTSQFGVEYAGRDAIFEAARLVAPDGQLALMLHHHSGAIYRECADSLEAIRRLQACQFVPLAIAMFEAGFRAVRGGDRSDYEAAGKQFAPTIGTVEEILGDYGEHVAGDTMIRLYTDVGRIHTDIQHYEPADVLGWLKRMDGELDAFAGRMESMKQCAISDDEFKSVREQLTKSGFAINRAAPLATSAEELPLAWILVATRVPESQAAEAEQWTRWQMNQSVEFVMQKNLFESDFLEAKPAWSVTLQVLLCQVRAQGERGQFVWTISGNLPNDYLSSNAAANPRDAARHFAMKWQLDATRESEESAVLAAQAESLFQLVNDESLWY
jgi:ubiquinone/menaquinone biosynthesis C-methylase UbiE